MDYQIVIASSIDSLPSKVAEFIKKGYEPLGGPFALHSDGHYGQAVIKKNEQKSIEKVEYSDNDKQLLTSLKQKRLELTKNEVPAFRVATNKTLDSIVSLKPKTIEDMMNVHGIGKQKIEKYGQAFLDVVIAHMSK